MTKQEYVKTVYVDGVKVDIGMDDYGQSYFFEYMQDGKLIGRGCGTYNTDYMSCVMYELSEEYRDLCGKYYKDLLTEEEKERWDKLNQYIDEENDRV